MLKKIFRFITQHKIAASVIIIILIFAGYKTYPYFGGKQTDARYVLARVKKGTLTNSVSASGQILPVSQIDLKPKTSAEIIDINVKTGQEVKAGEVIAKLDSQEASDSLIEADLNLKSARLNLEKLSTPSGQSLNDDSAEVDTFNVVSSAANDLTAVINGLNDILHSSSYIYGDDGQEVKTYGRTAVNYRNTAEQKYTTSRGQYDKNLITYQTLSRNSSLETLKSALDQTYNTTKTASETVKSVKILVDYIMDQTKSDDRPASMIKDQTSLAGFDTQTSSNLESLLSAKTNLRDSNLDVQLQEITIKQKEITLSKSRRDLADYTIRAPFDGLITVVNATKGETASSSTTIASLITKQTSARITLNEIDAVKVKMGQKAILTFDALPETEFEGEVTEIGASGDYSEGVVSYVVKISPTKLDEQIKPGMTVSATIITDTKENVLLIPNSGLKSQAGINFVELASENLPLLLPSNTDRNQTITVLNSAPVRQYVEVGSTNDEFTEVIFGLKEGDIIVVNVMNQTANANNTQTGGGFRFFGAPASGGNVRINR